MSSATIENCPFDYTEDRLTAPARRRRRLLAPSRYSSRNPPTTAQLAAGRRLAVHLGRLRLDKKMRKDNSRAVFQLVDRTLNPALLSFSW